MVFTVRVKDKIARTTNMLRLRNWITTRLYLIVFEHCDTSQLLIDCYQVDYKSQNTSSKNIQKPWTIQRIIQMLIHILDKRCSTFSGLFRHSCHLLNVYQNCISENEVLVKDPLLRFETKWLEGLLYFFHLKTIIIEGNSQLEVSIVFSNIYRDLYLSH